MCIRWSRAEINELVSLHAQEKQVLHCENAAMRDLLLTHYSKDEPRTLNPKP